MITQLLVDGAPPESTLAGIITASAAVFTALGGLVLAIGVLIPILRNSKSTLNQVMDVHHIVNQQRTDAQRYQHALVMALKHAGIEVPADQSLPESDDD